MGPNHKLLIVAIIRQHAFEAGLPYDLTLLRSSISATGYAALIEQARREAADLIASTRAILPDPKPTNEEVARATIETMRKEFPHVHGTAPTQDNQS